MTKKQCEKGCISPETKKPVWHTKATECPYYSAPAQSATAEQPPATRTGATPAPTTSTPSPGGSIQKVGAESFAGSVAQKARHPDASTNVAVQQDWILDGGRTIDMVTMGFGGIHRCTDAADDYLEIPHIRDEFFQLTPREEQAIKANQRNMFSRFCTRILQWVGCKTLEEGQEAVDSASFFAIFGGLAAEVIVHFFNGVKASPKLKRTKEEKAKVAAEAKFAKSQQLGTAAQQLEQLAT